MMNSTGLLLNLIKAFEAKHAWFFICWFIFLNECINFFSISSLPGVSIQVNFCTLDTFYDFIAKNDFTVSSQEDIVITRIDLPDFLTFICKISSNHWTFIFRIKFLNNSVFLIPFHVRTIKLYFDLGFRLHDNLENISKVLDWNQVKFFVFRFILQEDDVMR